MNEENDLDSVTKHQLNVAPDLTSNPYMDAEHSQTVNDNDVPETNSSDRPNLSAERPPSTGHFHSFIPSLPPTSSTSIQISREQSVDTISDVDIADDNNEGEDSSLPKPLAVKPAYKKRIVVPARSDGLIRKSGALAALEKQLWEKLPNSKRTTSAPSIYDVSNPTENEQIPDHMQRQRPTPQPPKKKRKPRSKQKPPNSPPKIKRQKPVVLWRTPANDNQDSPHPRKSKFQSNVQPVNIEWVMKQQEKYKRKSTLLSTKPLPFQDLKTLVGTELEEEEKALRELGVLLHNEYLKLQLEEGVLISMLNLSQSGTLDVSDLERLRRRSKWSKSELRQLMEGSETHIKAKQSRRGRKKRNIQLLDGSNEDAPIIVDQERFNTISGENDAEGTPDEEDSEGDQDDEDDDEDDEVDQEEDMGGIDSELDMEDLPPIYSLSSESYTSRPLANSNESQGESAIGRPGASILQAYDSLDAIKRLVSKNSRKRKLGETALVDDEEEDEDDLFELEYDEDGDQPSNTEEDEDEEGSASGSEGEDEDYYSNNDDGDDDQQDEDDQTAREALQRMLSLYGAGT